MKTTPVSPRHPFGARLVRALSRTTSIAPASAAALVLGLLSASTAPAEVIAGIDSWSSAAAPAVSVTATGITATAATTGGWANNENADSGRGASNDTTWGTSSGPPSATAAILPNGNLSLTNGRAAGDLILTITSLGGALSGNNPHDDIDIDLDGLADRTLEDGGVAIIRLAFSGGTGSGAGHHLFLDNVAVTAEVVSDNKFVITAVPPGATAGSHFSVTVQAQDDMGAPFNVTQDTEISLGASGTGTISGNTATLAPIHPVASPARSRLPLPESPAATINGPRPMSEGRLPNRTSTSMACLTASRSS